MLMVDGCVEEVLVNDITISGKSFKTVDCRATGGAKGHQGVQRGIEGEGHAGC
jgi:hypothetical protein